MVNPKKAVFITHHLYIPQTELVFRFSRSSGPGGQNVNKVNTKVSLSFDLLQSASLSENQKQKISEVLGKRISKDGVLTLTSGEHRSQNANRIAVIERFQSLISQALVPRKKRVKTKPSRASRERRLKTKQHRSNLKKQRKTGHSE